ncbi:hypothetical protein IG631_23045 [Alternaria alternata]|nr:hypothetical protein IG631_23045 [Alternaria alternata]
MIERFASQQTGSYIAIPVDVIDKVLLNMQSYYDLSCTKLPALYPVDLVIVSFFCEYRALSSLTSIELFVTSLTWSFVLSFICIRMLVAPSNRILESVWSSDTTLVLHP